MNNKRKSFWLNWVNKNIKNPQKISAMLATKEKQADYDTLTQALNRNGMLRMSTKVIGLVRRKKSDMALLFVDIDDLKKVNDSKGHPAGDELIKEIAKNIKVSLRDTDLLCRWGGDEFLALLPFTDLKKTADVLARIGSNMPEGRSVTIGRVKWNNELTFEQNIKAADKNMYKIKKKKKNA